MLWELIGLGDSKNKREYAGSPNGPPGTKRYLTVNNGDRRWIVEDYPAKKRVIIYKNSEIAERFVEIPYKKLWLSHSDGEQFTVDGPWYKGNTVLLETAGSRFVLVADRLREFKLKPGDQPVKFVSFIGNNDSPYPYLIGKEHVYTMWDAESIFVYPVSSFDLTRNIVDQELGNGEFKDAAIPVGREAITPKELRGRKPSKTRKNRG